MTTLNQAVDRHLPASMGMDFPEQRKLASSTTLELRAGQGIYREGQRAAAIYQVQSGAVRVYRLMQNGHRHILSFYGPNEWFGLQDGLFHDDFAEAICASQLRSFSISGLPTLPVNLLGIALNSLAYANSRQLMIVRQSALERVAVFVKEMADRRPGISEFELMMSRADIADYLGLTVESVARSFTKLRTSGIIRLHGRGQRYVRIVNPEALAALSM
ncbi:helix-turn-helix domain-containing protein [Rhizobium mayense]|uniref:Helix-turn-helix domain-containing protein n=1 Tax=Rhizobium mayense TaxID=1312184 RepID=A0ABT7JVA5_9HYPH|nr:helix-turn-helix domain-containing protein [Rhizobium mayense]MDL2398854.1 helix-turn-helix domain-containing protein [Rhizobium mayense]